MFKQRVFTALLLVFLVLLSLYFANRWLLVTGIFLFVLGAGWEWSQLIPLTYRPYKYGFVLIVVAFVWISLHWFYCVLYIGLTLWGAIFIAVCTFPRTIQSWGHPWIVGASCLVLLPLATSTLVALYHEPNGCDLILYLLSLVWATDIGAYMVGKVWGRHKLIPKVSPGKTVEGFLGGFIMAMGVAVVGYRHFLPPFGAYWFMIAALTACVSVLGDLFMSMLKRRCHVKDTGHIFPGHGGLLDRIDSLLAALPFFYFSLCVELGR